MGFSRLLLKPEQQFCSFVKKHLLPFCLELAASDIIGIRTTVAEMLPSLLACCAPRNDQGLREQLLAAHQALLADSSVHVAAAAQRHALPEKASACLLMRRCQFDVACT